MKKTITKVRKSLQLRFEIFNLMRSLLASSINPQKVESVIQRLSLRFDVDLLNLAHHNWGIARPIDFDSTGERFLLNHTLKRYIKKDKPILFDVGANMGDYSQELRRAFPNGIIFSFEPNREAFEYAAENLAPFGVHCYNLGLGANSGNAKIYTYADDSLSQHASLYKEVFLDLHKADQLSEFEFQLTSVDQFCEKHRIDFIDFIKIDTEGHELEVLKGAARMLADNRISIIQFEFNTLHVISRVFLKDFYESLEGHNIFRLNANRLMPLFEYSTVNEIFRFQNLLAVSKTLALN